jgi:phage regulator Rha-like protein
MIDNYENLVSLVVEKSRKLKLLYVKRWHFLNKKLLFTEKSAIVSTIFYHKNYDLA